MPGGDFLVDAVMFDCFYPWSSARSWLRVRMSIWGLAATFDEMDNVAVSKAYAPDVPVLI